MASLTAQWSNWHRKEAASDIGGVEGGDSANEQQQDNRRCKRSPKKRMNTLTCRHCKRGEPTQGNMCRKK
jgi:hypothetical protein